MYVQPFSNCIYSSLTLNTQLPSSACRSIFLPWILKLKAKCKHCELLVCCVTSPRLETDACSCRSHLHRSLLPTFDCVVFPPPPPGWHLCVGYSYWPSEQWYLGCSGTVQEARDCIPPVSLRPHCKSYYPCVVVWFNFSHVMKHAGHSLHA